MSLRISLNHNIAGHGRHGSHNHFRRDEDVDDGFRESSSAWGTSTKIEDDGGFGGRGMSRIQLSLQ
ncbi:hypothetical protein BT96DRAFT_922856 [Gymnopus androsaceus JB14]|uniref:Uncharacterized protein n=1 Tax=Gymnopus androsaceus JB14 TaxID=1447944 RepID=A0A6A4HBG6_9AGAR|nr:hypothetical protein BT96DRAFT_922856 [Gymnopus androsaceus JB14]